MNMCELTAMPISSAVCLALWERTTPRAALIYFGVRQVSRRFWIAAIH